MSDWCRDYPGGNYFGEVLRELLEEKGVEGVEDLVARTPERELRRIAAHELCEEMASTDRQRVIAVDLFTAVARALDLSEEEMNRLGIVYILDREPVAEVE